MGLVDASENVPLERVLFNRTALRNSGPSPPRSQSRVNAEGTARSANEGCERAPDPPSECLDARHCVRHSEPPEGPRCPDPNNALENATREGGIAATAGAPSSGARNLDGPRRNSNRQILPARFGSPRVSSSWSGRGPPWVEPAAPSCEPESRPSTSLRTPERTDRRRTFASVRVRV